MLQKLLKVINVTLPPRQATVLEEMPPFPDRESSLLAKLYQTAPWTAKLHQEEGEEKETAGVRETCTADKLA